MSVKLSEVAKQVKKDLEKDNIRTTDKQIQVAVDKALNNRGFTDIASMKKAIAEEIRKDIKDVKHSAKNGDNSNSVNSDSNTVANEEQINTSISHRDDNLVQKREEEDDDKENKEWNPFACKDR